MGNEIKYGRKKVNIPSDWNELTKKQYLFVCKVFAELLTKGEKISSSEFYGSKIVLLKYFLKMPLSKFQYVDAEQLACLLPLIEFLDKDITLNKNLVPSFYCLGFKYYGPKDEMDSSTMGEFVSADTYFIKSQNTHDELMMCKLIATLYRPKQRFIFIKKWLGIWDGDMRQKYNQATIERRALFFKRYLNSKYQWSTLYFYMGFRKHNVTTFTNLFPKSTDANEKNVHKKIGNDYGWAGTILEMAGDKFGDLKKTEEVNWFTLFVEMSRQIDKSQQQHH